MSAERGIGKDECETDLISVMGTMKRRTPRHNYYFFYKQIRGEILTARDYINDITE